MSKKIVQNKTLSANCEESKGPLYLQIAEQIREGIKSSKGKYSPGQKLPCEIDLASELSVSPVTLHRSLRILADEGLLQRKRGTGTFVCSQKMPLSNIVGLLVTNLSDLAHPATSEVVKAIEAAMKEELYELTLCCLAKFKEDDPGYGFTFPGNQSLAGTIVISQEVPVSYCEKLAADIPTVLLHKVKKVKKASGIEIDYAEGIRKAVNYLISLGHTRIGFLLGPRGEEYPVTEQQKMGAKAAMDAAAIHFKNDYMLFGTYSEKDGYSMCSHILEMPEPPTAVICGDDHMAVGAVQAARSKDLIVGKNFSVIGGNDMPAATIIEPSLTTLAVNGQEIGTALAKMLINMINSRITVTQISYEPRLIIRDSTGPCMIRT